MTVYDYGVSPPLTKADTYDPHRMWSEPETTKQVQAYLPQARLKAHRDPYTGELTVSVKEFQGWLTLCAERFDTLELATPGIITRCLRDYLDKLAIIDE